jgi:hypothetical protein
MYRDQQKQIRAIGKAILWLVFALIGLFGISGCTASSFSVSGSNILDWKYSDLRVLDPVDAQDPEQDLVAAYARKASNSFQVRLDFLDLGDYLGKDIFIMIDTSTGGTNQIKRNSNNLITAGINWDYLIEIADPRTINVVNSQYSLQDDEQVFVVYDSTQDRIMIDLLNSQLPIVVGKTKIQVIITKPGETQISDISNVFSLDGTPPPRDQVTLTFWNTFSSKTPAQTLRSWAGAHSGPIRSRHGLSYLLRAAERTKTPISLLDLATDEKISALDYIGELSFVNNLIAHQIVNVYVDKEIIHNNDGKLFINDSLFNNNIGDNDYAHYIKLSNPCNLSSVEYFTSETEALSLDCKKWLITHAITDPTTLSVIGGDFSMSLFGEPGASDELLGYFANHPWIQVVPGADLLAQKGMVRIGHLVARAAHNDTAWNSAIITSENNSNLIPKVRSIYGALLQAPDNTITRTAWNIFAYLTGPDARNTETLKANYIGQIGELLNVAKWAEEPSIIQDCNIDIDYDSVNECVLANKTVYLIADPQGGYIPFVFYKNSWGIHQIIGPTWELMVGLSDPSTWDASLGVRSDPAQVLGAMQDSFTEWNSYQPSISESSLSLTNDDGTARKSITIDDKGFQLVIQSSRQPSVDLTIPLVLDPWYRFNKNWGTAYTKSGPSPDFHWGITNDESIMVVSSNQVNAYSFIDSYSMMKEPEDPNYDYSPGHYLPYPMAIVEVTGPQDMSIEVRMDP